MAPRRDHTLGDLHRPQPAQARRLPHAVFDNDNTTNDDNATTNTNSNDIIIYCHITLLYYYMVYYSIVGFVMY